MSVLLSTTITSPVSAQVGGTVSSLYDKNVLAAVANFDYGSGGGTARVWVQTTFDEGESWVDVANFTFTNSDALKAAALGHPTHGTANFAVTDGSLADNTIAAVPVGNLVRTKLTTTGTYGGATTLKVNLIAKDI